MAQFALSLIWRKRYYDAYRHGLLYIKDWTQCNLAVLKAVGWAFLQKISVKIPLNIKAFKGDSN